MNEDVADKEIEALIAQLALPEMNSAVLGSEAVPAEQQRDALHTHVRDLRAASPYDALGEAAERLAALGSRAVAPLLRLGLRSPSWGVRNTSVMLLGEIGDVRAVEPLIAALDDDNGIVRSGVAAALGKLGDARAVEPLLQRLAAAEPAFKPASLIPPGGAASLDLRGKMRVMRAVMDGSFMGSAAGVASALAEIGDRRATLPLIETLNSLDATTQREAAEALGKLGDPRAVEPLHTLLARLNEFAPPTPEPAETPGASIEEQARYALAQIQEFPTQMLRDAVQAALDQLANVPSEPPTAF